MNERDIRSIEKRFSIALPNGYRRMLSSPPEYFAALMKFDEKANPGQTPFFMDRRMIEGANLMMRDRDDPLYFGFDPNDPEVPWPERYFIIGSDVGGNFYCIAPKTGRSRTYFWEQGDSAFPKFADDMAGFVKRIFKIYGEVDAMDCTGDEPD